MPQIRQAARKIINLFDKAREYDQELRARQPQMEKVAIFWDRYGADLGVKSLAYLVLIAIETGLFGFVSYGILDESVFANVYLRYGTMVVTTVCLVVIFNGLLESVNSLGWFTQGTAKFNATLFGDSPTPNPLTRRANQLNDAKAWVMMLIFTGVVAACGIYRWNIYVTDGRGDVWDPDFTGMALVLFISLGFSFLMLFLHESTTLLRKCRRIKRRGKRLQARRNTFAAKAISDGDDILSGYLAPSGARIHQFMGTASPTIADPIVNEALDHYRASFHHPAEYAFLRPEQSFEVTFHFNGGLPPRPVNVLITTAEGEDIPFLTDADGKLIGSVRSYHRRVSVFNFDGLHYNDFALPENDLRIDLSLPYGGRSADSDETSSTLPLSDGRAA